MNAKQSRWKLRRSVLPTWLLTLEPLEDRLVFSTRAANVFAQFDGVLARPADTQQIPIALAPRDFSLAPAHHSLLLGFLLKQGDGSTLNPAAVQIRNEDGRAVQPTLVKTGLAGNRESLVLASLALDHYRLTVAGQAGTAGAFQLDVSLVGDVNGDRKVDQTDLNLLNSLLGVQAGDSRYRVEADAGLDGRITLQDVSLANQNLGDQVHLNPLTLTVAVSPTPVRLPSGTLATAQRQVRLTGTTDPGATVSLDSRGTNRFDEDATRADARGNFTVEADLQEGLNTLRVRARDDFGQEQVTSIQILRDTQPPTVVLTAPTNGLLTNHNITVTGQASDTGSGVASVQARVDTGAFFPVTFDATGHFQFDTTLPLTGTADGRHTAQVQAADRVGNLSRLASIQFTLDTKPPVAQLPLPASFSDASPYFDVFFSQDMAAPAFAAANYSLAVDGGPEDGQALGIVSITRVNARTARLNLADTLPEQSFRLTIAATVTDLAGNPVAQPRTLRFTVARPVNVFAVFDGALASATDTRTIPINLTAQDFTLGNGHRLLLGFHLSPGIGSSLDPTAVQIRTMDGALVTPVFANPNLAGNTQSLVVADLDLTRYTLTIGSQRGTAGAFHLEVFLVGDINGDRVVNHLDHELLESVRGSVAGDHHYRVAADANLDGRIDNTDMFFLDHNENAATRVNPLTVTLQVTPSPVQLSDTLLVTPTKNSQVTGTTNPRALVILTRDGMGLGSAVADAQGHYALPVTLNEGANTLIVQAADTFGQMQTATLTVSLDTQPPVVRIDSPVAGLVTNQNVTVTGDVFDAISGVASLQARVDSGAFISVTFDENGAFSFETTLSLNGTADGSHTVHFQATDRVGNVSGFFDVPFTLDTIPPTVVLQGPTSGLLINHNLTITGRTTDTGSGVATLKAQVDAAGLPVSVAFNAAGNFTFTTTLSLSGGADGAHTVSFQATDKAGNVSSFSDVTFTLDTRPPTATIYPMGTLTTILSFFDVFYDEPMAPSAFTAANYLLAVDGGPTDGQPVAIASVMALDASTAHITLAAPLPDQNYRFSIGAAVTDLAGNARTNTLPFRFTVNTRQFQVTNHTPLNGATDVGVTYRPQVFFSRPIDPSTLNANNFYATLSGQKLPATIVPADTGLFAWLFFTSPMQGGAQIQVTLDGSTIHPLGGGPALDAAGTGQAGSLLKYSFRTVSIQSVPNTSFTGIVVDPGPDLKPDTADDVRIGPDGKPIYLLPIAGVQVYLIGRESQVAVTGADGRFRLDNIPVGDVKLVINGRTATAPPPGIYYPEMVMDMMMQPGVVNVGMNGMPAMYLPRLNTSILKNVNVATTTHITVDANAAPVLTPDQQQYLKIDIAPNSLVGANGQKLSSGQVGISTVPPELVQAMLPPGVLQHAFDITVQAPGIVTFSTPAAMTFPNIFNGRPGEKFDFLSFDHTTGRLVLEGTATVSADGKSVATDPGTGITHPGWHGLTPAGTPTTPPCNPKDPHDNMVPPVPYTKGLDQDYFSAVNGDRYDLYVANLAQVPPNSQCQATPLVVRFDVDGPADDFLTGLTSEVVTLAPGQDELLPVIQSLPAAVSSFDADQLFGVHVHVTGYKDGDPNHLLIDKRINIARYVAVVDPAGNSFNAFFVKTLATGSGLGGFVRKKGLDYHLPTAVDTVFLARGGDSGLFDLGPSVSGTGTATWQFEPSDAGTFSTTVAIQINDFELPQTLTAVGTGVLPSYVAISIDQYEADLRAYLTNPNNFLTDPMGNRLPGTASQAFRREFAMVLPAANPTAAQINATVTAQGAALLDDVNLRYSPVNASANAVTIVAYVGIFNVNWIAGFRGNEFGRAGLDADKATLSAILPDPNLSEAAKEWAFAQSLNQGRTKSAAVAFNTMAQAKLITKFSDLVAQVVSHELGHTFGLLDSYISQNGGGKDVNPPNDIMASGSGTHYAFADVNIATLRAAMGVAPDKVGSLTDAIKVYRQNFNLPDNPMGLDVPPDIAAPSLGIRGPGDDLLNGASISAGTVLADNSGGHTALIPLTLTNTGTAPLTIQTVVLTNNSRAFSMVGSSPAGLTLGIGQSVALNLVFAPLVVGPAADTLTITTDAPDSPFRLQVTGSGLTPSGQLLVTLNRDPATGRPQNNVGGLLLNATPLTMSSFATLTNSGGGPLTITNITPSDLGIGQFTVTGLPAGFGPSNPLVLSPGQSFSFNVVFAPTHVGLQRGEILISSNDPGKPVFHLKVVGTGLTVNNTALHYSQDFVAIETPDVPGEPVLRMRSDDQGNWSFFLPPKARYHFAIFDPVSGLIAHGYGVSSASGQPTQLATPVFLASTAVDTDGDGLPDDVEFAVGTSPLLVSTAGDGISDFAKVIQLGIDPLGGLGVTGVIAGLPLPGEARKVVILGSASDPTKQTAYVATGSGGLAIVDVSQFSKPILLGQLALPETTVDIAVDSRLHIAAVTTANGVLDLVDVSDPTAPKLIKSIVVGGSSNPRVQIIDSLAYVTQGPNLGAYDILTAQPLQTLTLGGSTLNTLAREGTFLYAVDSRDMLRAVDLSSGQMVARGSLQLPHGGGQLFVGSGIAYVGAADYTRPPFPIGGFVTANVSNPDNLTLLSDSRVPPGSNLPSTAIVSNGSGAGLLAGTIVQLGPSGPETVPSLVLMNVADPTNTYAFLTRFTLLAAPFDLTVGSGIAFVADGTGGLQVVNYLPFDTKGQPPAVTLTSSAVDLDPNTPGVQVLKGSTLPLKAIVTDDVQVRNVELLVNGQVVQNAVSFPFNFSAVALGLSPGATTVTVQVRATDTGGNSSLSNLLIFYLLPDLTPPAITSIDPMPGSTRAPGLQRVEVRFSKPLDGSTVTTNTFQLRDGSGMVITPLDLQLRADNQIVDLIFNPLSAGSYQLVIMAPSVMDRAGNPLGATNVVNGFTLAMMGTITWANPQGGFWDDPTNWSTGALPGPMDDVVIDVPATITFRQGTTVIHSLRSQSPITITGGSLSLTAASVINNSVVFTGGTIRGIGDLTINGLLSWSGGFMFDAAQTIANGGINFSGSTTVGKVLDQRNLVNTGAATGTTGVTLPTVVIRNGGAINNQVGATFDVTGTFNGVFNNAGLLRSRGTTFAGTFNNTGTVQVVSRMSLQNGTSSGSFTVVAGAGLTLGSQVPAGTYTFTATSSVTGAGTVGFFGGTVTVAGTYNLSGFTNVGGGTVTFTGVASTGQLTLQGNLTGAGTLTVTGSFGWSSGTMSGTGETRIVAGAVLTIGNTLSKTLSQRTLTNAGTITWQSGNIMAGDGAIITNLAGATFSLPLNSGSLLYSNSGAMPTFTNAGTLSRVNSQTPGTGSVTIAIPFTNTGTVDVHLGTVTPNILSFTGDFSNAGTVMIGTGSTLSVTGNYTQTAGLTNLLGGTLTATGLVDLQGGVLAGSGTINGNVNNAGQVNPGGTGAAGTLAITGTFSQTAAGALNLEIGGLTAGTQFDQLTVTGAATLNGTLNLTLINNFTPSLGDNYIILTYASVSGTFATINGLSLGSGKDFSPVYNATNLTLTVVAGTAPGAGSGGGSGSRFVVTTAGDLTAGELVSSLGLSLTVVTGSFRISNAIGTIPQDQPIGLSQSVQGAWPTEATTHEATNDQTTWPQASLHLAPIARKDWLDRAFADLDATLWEEEFIL